MKKSMSIILCAVLLVMLLCGCYDDSHYYNYDYDSMERFLKNCASYDVDEYFRNHYSDNDLIEMLGKDAIMDQAIGAGWMDECVESYYGSDDFDAGYSFGYEMGYGDGWVKGFDAGLNYEEN